MMSGGDGRMMTLTDCMKHDFERLCLAAWRANIKEEEFYIGGEKYSIAPGEFIRSLLEIKQEFLHEVFQIGVYVHSICEEKTLLRTIDLDDFITTIEQLLEKINSILFLPSSSSELLKKMLRLLPAQGAIENYVRRREQKLHSYFEISDAEAQESSQIEKWREKPNDYDMEATLWQEWVDILRYGIAGFKHRVADNYMKLDYVQIFKIIKEYSDNLCRICAEADKIVKVLPILTGIEDPHGLTLEEIQYDYISTLPLALSLWKEQSDIVFGETVDANNRGYIIVALSMLVKLELELCLSCGLKFKKCAFCGGIFATKDKKRIYCSYPNQFYSGKPCDKIYSKNYYLRKKQPATPRSEYEDNKNTYQQWIRRVTTLYGKKQQKDIQIIITIIKTVIDINGDQIVKVIYDEIKQIFHNWNDNALKKLKAYELGGISLHECQKAIELPPVAQRSTILSVRKDLDIYKNEDFLKEKGFIKDDNK